LTSWVTFFEQPVVSPAVAKAKGLVIRTLTSTHVELAGNGSLEFDRLEAGPDMGVVAPGLRL
jgi:hypothetical protein